MNNRVNYFKVRRGLSFILAGFFLFNHQSVLSSIESITPGTQAASSSRQSGYTLVSDGKPVLWKSCSTIKYVVSEDTSAAELATLKKAFAIESELTGHKFQFLGKVKDQASNKWASKKYAGLEYSPVLITWTDEDNDLINGLTAGGTLANPTRGENPELVTGSITFDRSIYNTLNPGFGSGNSQGNLVLHELGHLLGLDHSDGKSDLMNPLISEHTHKGYTTSEENLLSNKCQ
jgi:hypothetical protein